MKELLLRYGLIDDTSIIRAYWWAGEGNRNFGDIVTPYLIEKITSKKPLHCSPYCLRDFYLMTGSILRRSGKHAIVWGTGMMKRDQLIKRPKKVHAVRGPVTRSRLLELGYECPEIYGDPALLLPRFYNPQLQKKWRVGIIPHYVDYHDVRRRITGEDIHVIDLLAPVEQVVDQILRSEWTISSSLHGLIVSQTYKIPSCWVKFSNNIVGDNTKFKDYFLSVGIDPYEPENLGEGELTRQRILQYEEMTTATIDIDLDKLMQSCPLL